MTDSPIKRRIAITPLNTGARTIPVLVSQPCQRTVQPSRFVDARKPNPVVAATAATVRMIVAGALGEIPQAPRP